MKFLIYSDLHLEFGKFPNKFLPDPSTYDVVILAGDIGLKASGVAWAGETFKGKTIYYICGNHEFYRNDLDLYDRLNKEAFEKHGVYFLQDMVIYRDTYRILGCTLWTDFQLDKEQSYGMQIAPGFLNDFHLIKDYGKTFTPENMLNRHRTSMEFLCSELEKTFDGKTIVMTHHAPSAKSTNQKYAGSNFNHLYMSNFDWMMEKYKIDFWIHGHCHDTNIYKIGNTQIVSNPRGYIGYGHGPGGCENANWDPHLTIEV